ncbi:unnamed protein product [Acanthoscelides obtectus]|uniref:Uncharacterized protein n=1 Tax=Acanthoscelides obtectus TaxID=200917 RepID=A0A9P0PR11_ACAOB|nr:unnamed protein product [Acanthoscelides obtectus]
MLEKIRSRILCQQRLCFVFSKNKLGRWTYASNRPPVLTHHTLEATTTSLLPVYHLHLSSMPMSFERSVNQYFYWITVITRTWKVT